MDTNWQSSVYKPLILPEPFPERFTEKELSAILGVILETIDVPFKKSGPVPKTILIDAFGPPKSLKTSAIVELDKVVRRCGLNSFFTQETAEREEIRGEKYADNPLVFQAKHDHGVEHDILDLAYHPRIHVAMTSRGLIDRLYWYKRDMQKSLYSEAYYDSIKTHIYEILKRDVVDLFLFMTCSPEVALEREYGQALTRKPGSNMNKENLTKAAAIYQEIIDDARGNVPGINIVTIDTSELSVQEAAQEVLRHAIPAICRRFSVPSSHFLPQSVDLMRKTAKRSIDFEEQLKLKGHPDKKLLENQGWVCTTICEQLDDYFNPNQDQTNLNAVSGECIKVRSDNRGLRFMYKGQPQDKIFARRNYLPFYINTEIEEDIRKRYPFIRSIQKHREYYQLKRIYNGKDEFLFTLHVDTVEGLGNFTEIRIFGPEDFNFTREILELAGKLGFGLADIVEDNYLSLALKQQSS